MPSVEKREVLESWKEISAYLNRNVKTCQRWEQNLELPIRRLDGTSRARVFAYKDELDFWLRDKLNNKEITTTKYLRTATKRPIRLWLVLSSGLLLIIVAAITLRFVLFPTLFSRAPEKPYLAVLPIKNFTGDESLGNLRDVLTNLVVTDLCQSKYIRVLPEERMNTILENLNKLQADFYTTRDFKKIAAQEGITHFLSGAVSKFGDSIRFNISVQKAGIWKIVWADDVRGTAQDMFSMVDALTMALKPHLNLTYEQIAADYDEKIENVTTPNMRALQFYLEAKEAFNKTEWNLAINLYERAVALDPDFAMAYRMLAGVYNVLGLEFRQSRYWDKMREFSTKASEAALRRPPSERERLIIEGTNQKDVAAGMEVFKRLLELYPDDDYGNYILGASYTQGNNYQKAEEHLKRIIGSTNNWTAYKWLGDVYLDQGRYKDAEDLFEAGIETFPKNWFFYHWMAKLCLLQRKFSEASYWCDKGYEIEPIQFQDYLIKGDILFFSGDYQAAEKEYRLCLGGENNRARINAAVRLVHLYKTQGRFTEMLVQAETAKQELVKDRVVDFDPINRELALLQAKAGNIQNALEMSDEIGHPPFRAKLQTEIFSIAKRWDEAQRFLRELELGLQVNSQNDWNMYLSKNGMEGPFQKQMRYAIYHMRIRLGLEQGRYLDAIADVEEAKSVYPGINVIPADLVELAGTAFYQLGDWESARKEFERITQMTYSRQEFGDIYAKSFYWLGKICEQLGKSKEAGENFERFLDLWKNADPGLPETEDTRTRLNSLR